MTVNHRSLHNFYSIFVFLSFYVSSYRSWLEKIRKESPAFLTIISLELPESPIPLIESQANARWRRDESNEVVKDKDDILDEFLKRVTEIEKDREKESHVGRNNVPWKTTCRRSSKKDSESLECTKTPATLEECTRNIIEGQFTYFSFRIK